MIDLYYWTTPNGHKITIFLEEAELPYRIVPVNISKGEQFKPDFLAISPNNRMPAIVDRNPKDGGGPISVFESGAILLYLAEKTGKFPPSGLRDRIEVMEWLFWQMAGLGPDGGPKSSLLPIRAGENPLRHRALRQRDQPALWRAEQASRRSRIRHQATTPSPIWPFIRGSCLTSGKVKSSKTFLTSSVGSKRCMAAPPWGARTRKRRRSTPRRRSARSRRSFCSVKPQPSSGDSRTFGVDPGGSHEARMTLRMYDLAGAEPRRRFSPYCWRIRLALAHKELAVETIPWRFTKKTEIAASGSDAPACVGGR